MAHCIYCGVAQPDGVRFCGECGREAPPPAAPAAAMAPPPPLIPPPPPSPLAPPMALASSAARPPGLAPQPGQTAFEVIQYEMWRMPKIAINQAGVFLEAGQLHYMLGYVQMQADAPSLGGFAKSMLTKEKAVRPYYSGSGEIYLTPTFGEVNLLDLRGNEEWILDKGCYLASDAGVQIGLHQNKMMTSMFGGEGMFQTSVKGVGKVFYWSPGVVQRIELQGQVLTVDGSFAVARTGSLEFKVERATKGILGSMLSGEGMVNTFSGYGSVMLAPMSNRYMTMISHFGGLHAAIQAIRRSG